MQDERKDNPPVNESPAVHQQPNVAQNEGLQANLNENPRANENIADTSGNQVVKGDGQGVGSEITDGEAG
ncbi:hypothetical protein SAMN05444008_10433 [Cnuella takakiae]|uniref:Uncharacterized protein n=1 Tax=Cnuella takakiae TaxID=1302690 RepID=A0A1M4XTX1_9BACT|nr:hypothetical protein [Cnuella takakiae]OLY92937.1 hypothetical protein BUE76_14345 [Cnuella takakiae]SHE96692.1 hypothetical protein SAMN05444008_10433 [Cnuella takakiae]